MPRIRRRLLVPLPRSGLALALALALGLVPARAGRSSCRPAGENLRPLGRSCDALGIGRWRRRR